jgi:ADP-ribosylglycohydrolase
MRAVPIGVYSTPEKVIDFATIQAAITHNTPDGVNAALGAALMSHYFISQLGNKSALGKFIESYVPGGCSQPWQGKVKTGATRSCKVGQKVCDR